MPVSVKALASFLEICSLGLWHRTGTNDVSRKIWYTIKSIKREFSETEREEHKAELLCLICETWRPYRVFFLHWLKKNQPLADYSCRHQHTNILRLPRAAAAHGGCWHRWCRHHGCKVQLQWHLQCLADKSERRGGRAGPRVRDVRDVGLLDNREAEFPRHWFHNKGKHLSY